MDQNERAKLQKLYEEYADAQVLELLGDGPDAFVEGAYALLEEEARRRGIALNAAPEMEREDDGNPAAQVPGAEELPETFVEIMVIDTDEDREAAAKAMEAADIPYHFMKMSMAGKDLPVALMTDQRRIEEAVAKLQPVDFTGSIVLW
ncbi:MAG TPA: hypothetical protein PLP56_00545 [Candidatus Omnitrophota bacterium]|nr:hypothetical protein [Candidatus Omnitrophota bacterium]HNQ50860.1 hypothetical protein [Candidatus Omnitrophota bacterium]HQO37941.1 hypothetical protein [Candidatus Omnitrophota bacterium]HQQ05452.1 hypothetical protein [Candidatus Omnitrophota bacterium]